jgi:hypothetical protein
MLVIIYLFDSAKISKRYETAAPQTPIGEDFANFETIFANFESRCTKSNFFYTHFIKITKNIHLLFVAVE